VVEISGRTLENAGNLLVAAPKVALLLIVSQMTKVSASAPLAPDEATGARDVIRLVADMVTLVEPRLLAAWRATGITFSQRRLLRQLREGPRTAGEVAASLGISPPALTRQLTTLEKRGVVSRATDTSDRRKVLVDLTAEGKRVLTGYRVFTGSPMARAARHLTAAQRQSVIESLALLVKLARELESPDLDE
jgi:DNA-binding MarR family transcriptional regulator